MPPSLSVIIPCYNCEKTLREAVDSCFVQELNSDEFEIVMVDDGSSDDTRTLMERLATERPNIRLIFHEINKGGGAARNTGIKAATGKIIYCLDSDNVFAPNSVRPMLDYLEEKKVDGVAFYERRFFFGQNLKRYTVKINPIVNRNIDLLDLFNESNTLLDNFFYTKDSYLRTLGYPEHHGFDTQCFEIRYLAAGNTVQICPDSIFYHRQAMDEPSYFERVHNSGLFSINTMIIFEEIFHLFTPAIQLSLINFEIFTHNKSYELNIMDFLKNKVLASELIFIEDYKKYLVPESRELWLKNYPEQKDTSILVKAFSSIDNNNYILANSYLVDYVRKTSSLSHYLQFLNLRILHLISGTPYNQNISATLRDITQLTVKPLKHRGGKLWLFLRKNQYLNYLVQTLKKFKY